MKTIPLSGTDKEALVDDADFPLISRWKWKIHGNGYACRTVTGGHLVLMHRQLLPNVSEVDHKDLNKLNNQRENLRPSTRSQNCYNRTKQSNNKTGLKGVSWDEEKGKYRAVIQMNGRQKFLGRFDSPQDAASAYDAAAVLIAGEFARTNREVA